MASNNRLDQPRRQEKYWKWGCLFSLAFILFMILSHYVNNYILVLIAILTLAAMLYLATYTQKPWDYADAVAAVRKRETQTTGESLHWRIETAECVPYGNLWLLHFRLPKKVTYIVDPERRLIIGRRQRSPDEIMKQTDSSRVLATAAADSLAKKALDQSLEQHGIDTGLFPEDSDDEDD